MMPIESELSSAGCIDTPHQAAREPAGGLSPESDSGSGFWKGFLMSLLFSLPNLELKAEQSGFIEGYGSVFGGRDSQGDVVEFGAFTKSLKKTPPLMLWQHRQDAPIGKWTEAVEDTRGLYLRGKINTQTTAGRDAFEHLKAGDISGLSIGFRLPAGGSRTEGDTRYLHEIDLAEVSVVSMPANPEARITSVKAQTQKPNTLREFEHALMAIGFTRREAVALARKGFGAEPDDSEELSAALLRIRSATSIF